MQPVIFLMGPTASGKTAATEALVNQFPIEVVSVDSALVYKGMDIGTAKPDAAFLARVPHHLIDLCDPSEAYSAGQFRDDALSVIGDIHQRGNVPLLAGGTMLYFRSLLQLDNLPKADPELRAMLQRNIAEKGVQFMHKELEKVDPESALKLHPNDAQRILRALELYSLTGKPLSQLQTGKSGFDYPLLKLALLPDPRSALHNRIAQRLDQMFDSGFVAEVTQLHKRKDLDRELPAIRAVGYRQVWQYLENEVSLPEAKQLALFATRQLAKRQMTWLRKEPDLISFNPEQSGWQSDLARTVTDFLAEVEAGQR